MNKIPAKIYYEKATGDILMFTSEMDGDVEITTKEQDIQIYSQLKNKSLNDIDFIELEYGTLVITLNNAKSYKVNLDTKQLEVVYYTEDELKTIEQQNQETEALNNRVSDISSYLSNSDETTILNIENSILEMEKNKIINGGI